MAFHPQYGLLDTEELARCRRIFAAVRQQLELSGRSEIDLAPIAEVVLRVVRKNLHLDEHSLVRLSVVSLRNCIFDLGLPPRCAMEDEHPGNLLQLAETASAT